MRRPARLPSPFFLLLLSLVLSPLFAPPVEANELGPIRDPGELGAGGLLLRSAEGLREAPTIETDVRIEITGLIARTRVHQRFTNPTRDWVEGVYVFPLPEGAAVDSLEMHVGDRLIVGRVEERARAKAIYAEAKDSGRKASLVEQERPNLFTTSIANLGPEETVAVVLTYQEDVRYDQGRFGLRFPMVSTPRYMPGQRIATGFAGTGWSHNTDQVPDAERVSPPVVPPGSGRAHPVKVEVEIDAGFQLAEVTSESHPIVVRAEPNHRYRVALENESVPGHADFVLDWEPVVGSAPRAALFRERFEGEDYALLMVLPPQAESVSKSRVSRETILVIDTSGSMGGEPIVQAREAIRFALSTLQPEDAFNVIDFDSTVTKLFPTSAPATAEAIARARAWIDGREADGGTEMLPALEAALEPSNESRAVRQVIFVTDGAVGNESALFGLIERQLGASRLYTIGIGSAPNSHFMTKAAEFGRGTFTYIARPSEVTEKMGTLFSKIESPVLHDLSVDWDVDGVEAWPARIPDVYVGEPVVIAARLPEDAKEISLRGRREGETLDFSLSLEGGSEHEGVARLWARRKVASLMDGLPRGADPGRVSSEVATLGVRHQIVTRWTSLVAVDVTPTAPVGVTNDTRAVPGLIPKGTPFSNLFDPTDAGKRSRDRLDAPRAVAATPGIAGVAIGQPIAQISVGRLPQGGTPATLFLMIGSSLLGCAGWIWRRDHAARRTRREP